MCSRHAEEHGADSPESYVLLPFRVQLVDVEGPAWWRELQAMGPNDAAGQAREYARDQGDDVRVIRVERVDPTEAAADYADAQDAEVPA